MKEKLKNMTKKSTYWLSIAIVGMVVGISIQFVGAWTGPGTTAPNTNIAAPILTSGGQTINGKLVVKELCVGSDTAANCKTAWPAAGSTYAPGNKVFSTAGVTNWTVPAGVTQIHVEGWGGGGGGAAGRLTRSAAYAGYYYSVTGGGSGGGGGYAKVDLLTVKPGETLQIGVGAGGAGATKTADFTAPSTVSVGGTGSTTFVNYTDSTNKTINLFTALGGAGGVDHTNETGSTGRLDCDTNTFATGGTASSTITGAVIKSGNVGSKCISVEFYNDCSSGDCYWSKTLPIDPSFAASTGGLPSALISGFSYGAGGSGTSWGIFRDPLSSSTRNGNGANGAAGGVIITW